MARQTPPDRRVQTIEAALWPMREPAEQATTPETPVRRFTANLSGRSRKTPGEARRFVRLVLEQWRVPAEAAETALLIVSELVTNAVQHAASPNVTLCTSLTARTLLLRVVDDHPHRPLLLRPCDSDDETGRGLLIVKTFATSYGQHPTSTGGTAVWATLHLDAPPPPRRR